MSGKVDEHFVSLYQKAGEILWWISCNVDGNVELSAVPEAFKFHFVRRLPGGGLATWDRLLSFTELSQTPATPQQYGKMIADQFWNCFKAAEEGVPGVTRFSDVYSDVEPER